MTTYNDVQTSYQVLRALYKQGKIKELAYYKLVILYAADFSVLGYLDDAIGLLSSVPSDHFTNELARQLEEDDNFREKVLFLAQDMVESKKVTLDEDQSKQSKLDSMVYRVMLEVNKIGKA